MMEKSKREKIAGLALAASVSITIASCSDIFGKYENKVDPNAPNHQSETIEISGNTILSADATWSGNVAIAGNVTIPSGVTLTISPGTVLVVAAGNNFKLAVSSGGTLNVRGTADKPIVLLSDTSSKPSWFGIFQDLGTLKLEYCVIQDACYGVFINNGSNNSIEQCYFNNCEYGICCFERLETCRYNTFESCDVGIWDYSVYYGSSNTNSATYCIFADTNFGGIIIIGSNTTFNLSHSNFLSNSKDLVIDNNSTESNYISNSTVYSTHCYPASLSATIGSYNQNCLINVTNGETIPISTAGCGFNYVGNTRTVSMPPKGLALVTASAHAKKTIYNEAMTRKGR
jgi:hypothetical protein